MPRATTGLLGTAAVALLLAGCGGDGAPTATPATSQVSTSSTEPGSGPSASDAPADPDEPTAGAPEFPDDASPQFAEAAGAGLVLTDVRAAAHDGYDRVVLEFSGTGEPGWAVSYVDRAVMDGSGEAVRLDGDTVLDVYASGTTAPAAGYDDGPRRLQPLGDGGLAELYVVGTFEGTTQVLVGMDGEREPFRVFALTEPSRLVVDVEDADAD